MRKLLVVAAGLLSLLTALPVYAVDVNFSGEVRVRGFWDNNTTDGDSTVEDSNRFADLRFRLKTAIKAGVTTGVVVLDFSNCFGGPLNNGSTIDNTTGAFAGGTGNCRFGSGGVGHSYNVAGVREAHLNIDLKNVNLVLGRQTLKLGHGIIFDSTADAITAVLPLGGLSLTGSMVQVSDANSFGTVPGVNNDTTVWLVNLGMSRESHVFNIYDAYLYDQNPGTTWGSTFYPTVDGPVAAGVIGGDKIWINYFGISLDTKAGPFALALEGTYDAGNLEVAGLGTDARVYGYNLMGDATIDAGGAKLGGTVVYTSGQEQSATGDVNIADISGNFQLGNILVNGEMNTDREGSSLSGGVAGAGLFAVKLHADMMPTEKLDVSAALIYAQTTGQPCAGCQRNIGYELDANARYKVDDNTSFDFGAGYLFTGDGAQDFYGGAVGPADSDIWKLSAKAVFTF